MAARRDAALQRELKTLFGPLVTNPFDAVPEEALRERLHNHAIARGFLAYHTHDSRRSDAGYPDETYCGYGHLLALETKTTKGRVRPMQKRWLAELARVQTVHAALVRPQDEARICDLLDSIARAGGGLR